MMLSKTHLQYKICYLAIEALFAAVQMILYLMSVLSRIMMLVFKKNPIPSLLLNPTIMNPISTFLWTRTLFVNVPKLVINLTYMDRLKKINYNFKRNIKDEKVVEQLREILRDMIKQDSVSLSYLSNEEKILQLLLKNDRLYVLSTLQKEIQEQLLQDKFKLIISVIGVIQSIFLIFSPSSAATITIFYWAFVVMQYVIPHLINNIMTIRTSE